MTEAEVIELLRQRYTKVRPGTTADRFVRASHVNHPALYGYGQASRIADYLVLDTYETGSLIGHEVKVARSDWLRELRDLSKAEEWSRYCHQWYIAAGDNAIVRPEELPQEWGLMVQGENGLRVRKKAPMHTPQLAMPMNVMSYVGRAIAKTREKELKGRRE